MPLGYTGNYIGIENQDLSFRASSMVLIHSNSELLVLGQWCLIPVHPNTTNRRLRLEGLLESNLI